MEKERTQKITENRIKHQKDEVMIGDYNINLNHVQSHIYSIRNVDVMLDKELAILYGVETKVLNQAVKRNIRRFPERYMFQLSKEEWESLRSQIVTSKNGRGGDRYIPYVFTEQGITQLSTVLKSDTAIEVSIKIMDAFVAMRRFLSNNAGVFQRIEKLEQQQYTTKHEIEKVLKRMDELCPSTITPEQLFATGCVWDAWSYVSQLIRSAKQRIILIDNYVDDRVLTLLSKRDKGVKTTIYTRYTKQFVLDLEKHNEQYAHIDFIQLSQKNHDRFLIIDDDLYLMGASIKDMGKSLCAITKLEMQPETILSIIK